jgi:hypothetical protein
MAAPETLVRYPPDAADAAGRLCRLLVLLIECYSVVGDVVVGMIWTRMAAAASSSSILFDKYLCREIEEKKEPNQSVTT